MKKSLLLLALCGVCFGCVCTGEIDSAFNRVKQEVLTNNLSIANGNLDKEIASVKANRQGLQVTMEQDKKRLGAGQLELLALKEAVFIAEQTRAAEAKKNQAIIADTDVVLLQNEQLIIELQKLLNKERG